MKNKTRIVNSFPCDSRALLVYILDLEWVIYAYILYTGKYGADEVALTSSDNDE